MYFGLGKGVSSYKLSNPDRTCAHLVGHLSLAVQIQQNRRLFKQDALWWRISLPRDEERRSDG